MIRRTYGCDKCSKEWTLLHDSADEWCAKCPYCGAKSGWVPKPLRFKTNKSRAVDMAQTMAEQQYGLTNMKDNTREGEAVAMGPAAATTSDNDAVVRQTVDAMRQLANAQAGTVSPQMKEYLASSGEAFTDPTKHASAEQAVRAPGQVVPFSGPHNVQAAGQIVQMAAQATALARQENGESPMGMLHTARKHERNMPGRVPISGAKIIGSYKP